MLIIPTVSIGNVPQLALDLLIYTYGFKLVKSLDDSLLCPFLGPLDHLEGSEAVPGISTGAQLFKLGDDYIVQIRSPPLSGKKEEFINSLSEQLSELEYGDVLILGSANSGMDDRVHETASKLISELTSPRPLPESGFVNEALAKFPNSRALVAWVYEGDNFTESVALAHAAVAKIHLPEKSSFKQPVSWSRVYGKDIPLGMEQGLYT